MGRITFATLRRCLLFAIGTLALSGCGGDGSLPPPDVRGTIEVVNATTDLHVFRFFYRGCGSTNWGLDQLPDDPCTGDGCIAPQDRRDFIVEAGCYDLMAEFADLDLQEVVGSDSTLNLLVFVGETTTWNTNFNPPPSGPQ